MIQIPTDLAQRILDAARIAAAMHRESAPPAHANYLSAGGAGRVVIDHDGSLLMDGSAAPHDRAAAPTR
jgi:hypothetical protein